MPAQQRSSLIYPGAFAPAPLDAMRQCCRRVYEITENEAVGFIANGIVAGANYLTPRLTPNLQKILDREHLKTVVVDTSEFEKSGGSCYCMKNFVE